MPLTEEMKEYQRNYYSNNKEHIREQCRESYNKKRKENPSFRAAYNNRYRKWQQKLFRTVILGYGGKCSCCGFNDIIFKLYGISFLQVDHINGGGRQELKQIGDTRRFYQILIDNNFPSGYRILCRGCNNAMPPGEEKCLLHGNIISVPEFKNLFNME